MLGVALAAVGWHEDDECSWCTRLTGTNNPYREALFAHIMAYCGDLNLDWRGGFYRGEALARLVGRSRVGLTHGAVRPSRCRFSAHSMAFAVNSDRINHGCVRQA